VKFSDKKEDETLINLTPLIDVVFLLLIFFMVSTTFSKESQLRIKLPESSEEEMEEQEARILEIEINSDGVYAVKGPDEEAAKELLNTGRETLRRALVKVVQNDDEVITVIRADRRTPHESVIRAMDVSRKLGLTNITFATQTLPKDRGSP
jgi:biopolymer transport protein ExbD